MPEDTPQGEEQRTLLTFTEAAERLVKDKIATSMTAEGLRRLARDPSSGWPIGPGDYRMAGKVRMLPYELLAPFMRERLEKRPGRGPAKQPRKRRSSPPQQQGDPMTARRNLYAFAMRGKEQSPDNSEEATARINDFRAAALAEAVGALKATARELSELAEKEMRRDLEERAQEWQDAANTVARLALKPPTGQES
ncbi:hypothetical protein PV755_44670 [Streptomyces caniscabiei]|uniref:hypothetical protein n=1 Tax=Streptomyces caniscabiei TaxID=2746961 RepID=UPI0029BCE7F8|nr:hypothetical protein [Streptomyces caniscabiei]MDX3515917.1 hypothetical protein [Streptomyces caniscabiei]MDX3725097.1 hypothetical protein [Streptomyces caniscabiei]